MTMEAWLTRAARMRGERAALEGPGGTLGYQELHRRAREFGGSLLGRGLGPGDRVALALGSRELVVALHGCLLIGAAAVPIDLRLPAGERARRAAGAALVIDELSAGSAAPARELEPEEIATVMYTSGTTAGPKEVPLTVSNWLANAVGSALALGLDPRERWLCPMPLVHVGGLSIALRSAIYCTTVLLHERFDTEAVLESLMAADQRVTLVSLVPTMLSRLLDAGLHDPPTLRRVLLGGGPIPPSLLARARAQGVPVSPSYGMTEACSQIATDGWPLLGVELAIAVGGEVLVRGDTVSGAALSDDGWLHTGDLGRLDEAGRLEIYGRQADTIVTGGENVAPAAVEAALLEHPGVADAAVFGRADPQWGEAVVAHVVLGDGAVVAPEALRAHCAARLATFEVPKQVELVASLPRGVTGKLLRRELR
jgi:O-succinylbenzoic acid--CoA ligase